MQYCAAATHAAGVAGGDRGIGLGLGNHLAHHGDRTIRFAADGLDRRVVHSDDFGGVNRVIEEFLIAAQAAGGVPAVVEMTLFVADQMNPIVAVQ